MTPDPHTEDALAELLADRVIEMVQASHPTACPKFRRRMARLYLRQLTGSEQAPGRISMRRLAPHLGTSKTLIHNIEHGALAKLWLSHGSQLIHDLNP